MIIKRKNICYLRLYALKARDGNDNNQNFIQTAMGALGLFLFTFLPECTVHNMRISELGVPGLYIYWVRVRLDNGYFHHKKNYAFKLIKNYFKYNYYL